LLSTSTPLPSKSRIKPKNLERLSDAIAHNFSRPEDKDLLPPIVMLLGRLSKHEITPFIFPEPAEEDTNKLSLYEKIFLESMRQQLARFFAIAHKRLMLPCNLVCPFAWKGKPSRATLYRYLKLK
jgi:hypothetical protein